ncbi:AAA family ATPase [Azospirillum sp. HJ39]|uniref:AAA family ATPase n=1 Tax=Azospirillum sp. HJ39 TaxID=3159496 RepID=UPI003558E559
MTVVTARLQVTSFHAAGFGGGILIGRDPDAEGGKLMRARIHARVLPREPVEGEVWRVTGRIEGHPVFDHQRQRDEMADHIVADWAAPLAPQGDAIRRWIARNPRIKGVGVGYAERLWDALGTGLYDAIRRRDVEALAAVLDIPKAASIIDAFGLLLDEVTALEDLDGLGLDGRAANTAVALYGAQAGARFRENPYLMTLIEPWAKVDAAALASGVLPTDRRRLLSAVDVAASRAFRTTEHSNLGGHTVVTGTYLLPRVRAMLGRGAAAMAEAAMKMAVEVGDLIDLGSGRYQARAPWHMERQIEEAITDRLLRPRQPVDRAIIATVLSEVERENGIRFEPEQREAVFMALTSGVAAIAGGAGTGKSTIVQAVMRAARRAVGGDYAQVALSGRAAKRLREATGGDAMTIYRFLKDLEHGRFKLGRGLLVVDECSMVSTPDLWLLLTATPAEADILLVGDIGQLPPIKAGNPAAAIAASSCVPRVALRVPHRQDGASGIPQVAHGIREGHLPRLEAFDPGAADRQGVFLLPCGSADVAGKVLEAFGALAGPPPAAGDRGAVQRLHKADVQILGMTKHGPAGVAEVGDAVERRWMVNQPAIHDWGFHVGSKILWTKNSYDHRTGRVRDDGEEDVVDIMNGALGVLLRATAAGAEAWFDDGTTAEIRRNDLDRVLRGWAVTTHKAQGSAFRRVIIPIVRSRLLDRAMLYTAVTRARMTAVLVGDEDLVARAAAAPPSAWRRMQALDLDAAMERRRAA